MHAFPEYSFKEMELNIKRKKVKRRKKKQMKDMSKGSVCGQLVFSKSSSLLPSLPMPVSDAWVEGGLIDS